MNYLDLAKKTLENYRATVVESPKAEPVAVPTISSGEVAVTAGDETCLPTPPEVAPPPSALRCRCCGSTATRDVTFANGRLMHRECVNCGGVVKTIMRRGKLLEDGEW
jgi:hypothetical protein